MNDLFVYQLTIKFSLYLQSVRFYKKMQHIGSSGVIVCLDHSSIKPASHFVSKKILCISFPGMRTSIKTSEVDLQSPHHPTNQILLDVQQSNYMFMQILYIQETQMIGIGLTTTTKPYVPSIWGRLRDRAYN